MRLAELRTKAGLTQEELGRLTAENLDTKTHQARISHYENGRKRVPLDVAQRIVKMLNSRLKQKGLRTRARLEDLLQNKPRQRIQ